MIIAAAILFVIIIYSYATNPFSRWSLIRLPYKARVTRTTIQAIDHTHKLVVRQNKLWKAFAVLKSGIHILNTRYVRSPRSKGRNVVQIINDIHKLRFDPTKLLVISGDHFSGLYVRNLGVFYYPLLDPNSKTDRADWQNRQLVYLQSVAYALGVFSKYSVPTTTIMPTGPMAATCINFHAYPSDTVYGILYALAVLTGEEASHELYDYKLPHTQTLQTKAVSQALLVTYKQTLHSLYEHYRLTVFDETTGLIKLEVRLSGAKDITKRTCAFYDNVIFWKTTQLAMKLGTIPQDKAFLAALKARIIRSFWYKKGGYFLEDLSDEGQQQHYYSSDWLVVLFSGFLAPADPVEQSYFMRSVAYIQKTGIDKPFGLKYQHQTRAHRQFFIVRMAVASYGGDAIWSFWGMEYIKCLLLLYRQGGKLEYLKEADRQIAAYSQVMIRDGGFPEVYNRQGVMLQTPFYRSIRQTGWVVGFEQVLALRQSIAVS